MASTYNHMMQQQLPLIARRRMRTNVQKVIEEVACD